jgi:L-rhamnose isomerase
MEKVFKILPKVKWVEPPKDPYKDVLYMEDVNYVFYTGEFSAGNEIHHKLVTEDDIKKFLQNGVIYFGDRDAGNYYHSPWEDVWEYNKDIDITLEYKLKEPRTHSYISTVGTTLLMLNDINCDNAGIALDYGHAALGYETPAEAVAMCHMYGNRLKHIHINDNYRLWDDDMIVGSVHTLEYLEFIYWLRKTNYKGYITLDQFPYREDGRDAVNESAVWLDWLESLIDNADSEKIEAVLRHYVSNGVIAREPLAEFKAENIAKELVKGM